MPSAMTPVAERTVLSQPSGPDAVNRAFLMALIQGVANRGEWNAKKLVDVKSAKTSASDNDFSSTSFINAPSLAELTFTDVSAGDVIILDASLSLFTTEFTADSTDPGCEARFLVGGVTDVTVAVAEYPSVRWGSTVAASAEDRRMLTFRSVHVPAVAASSLEVRLQVRCPISGQVVYNPWTQIIGVHFRLGAG